MPWLSFNNARTFYEDQQGQGEVIHDLPVVLVHGWGSGSHEWDLTAPVLQRHGYRVIRPHLLGHGRSDKPASAYSVNLFAQQVISLMDHLKLEQVHLVGISMGGMVGFEMGVRHGDRLKTLTIVNSIPAVIVRGLKFRAFIAMQYIMTTFLPMSVLGRCMARAMFPKPEHEPIRQVFKQKWADNDRKTYKSTGRGLIGWSVLDQMESIQCPTLVVAGRRDFFPLDFKHAYAKRIPRARLEIIEDSGHVTPIDQPDRFNRMLLAFLDQV